MGEGIIDLRSDTVTKPGPAMRKAMAEAEVGDDVFGEDPTVNALQEEVADLFGKEAAIFVASGTMANQVSLKAHTQPGDEVVVHPGAHLYRAESAAGAALSGVQFRLVGNPDGTLSVQEIEGVIQSGDNPHFAPTRLICLENTHNFAGGSALLPEYVDTVAELAARHSLPMHLDGARVMNASVFLGVPPARLAAPFRSVTLCFSKGLGAPVGSIIAGPRDFIIRCHRFRKMFGGGMRQVGVLAAAARYAMKNNVERLAEDHANAALLARGLAESGQLRLPYGDPQTNLVFFSCHHPTVTLDGLTAALREKGILIVQLPGGVARAVTHLDINRQDIEKTVTVVNQLLAA